MEEFFNEITQIVTKINKIKKEKDIKQWLDEKDFLLPLGIAYYNSQLVKQTRCLAIATWVLVAANIVLLLIK